MKAIDAAAPEPVEVLIQRAGWAVARAALRELGGAYGRRVVVIAGKGNNGNDGRAAAAFLEQRGVRVAVYAAGEAPSVLPPCDLVIDAAFGTGFRGEYDPPDPVGARVLAVDVPSGPRARADVTVTFAALKPVLLVGDGATRAGRVEVADIGLDTSSARMHVVEDGDVVRLYPRRQREAHKWQTAVYVVAGSPGMLGAATLVSQAALRAGSGYVRLGIPGGDPARLPPSEVVGSSLPADGCVDDARRLAARTGAIVLLKGSTTVVANPAGEVLLAASGSPRLATAGTGDVLSGVIGGFLAAGMDPMAAAVLGAHVHGRAASRGA